MTSITPTSFDSRLDQMERGDFRIIDSKHVNLKAGTSTTIYTILDAAGQIVRDCKDRFPERTTRPSHLAEKKIVSVPSPTHISVGPGVYKEQNGMRHYVMDIRTLAEIDATPKVGPPPIPTSQAEPPSQPEPHTDPLPLANALTTQPPARRDSPPPEPTLPPPSASTPPPAAKAQPTHTEPPPVTPTSTMVKTDRVGREWIKTVACIAVTCIAFYINPIPFMIGLPIGLAYSLWKNKFTTPADRTFNRDITVSLSVAVCAYQFPAAFYFNHFAGAAAGIHCGDMLCRKFAKLIR